MRKLGFAGALVIVASLAGLRLLGEVTAPAQAPGPAIQGLSSSPSVEPTEFAVGKASWYGPGFHGRPTSSGVPYNRYALTAAHRTLRAGTVVRVTNLRNGRSAVLVVNDWGPVPADRVIDVSEAAAEVLGFKDRGLTRVRIEVYRAASTPL
jgi:rare lipoprotein A